MLLTKRLVIRRYELSDANALVTAKQATHEHLKPWFKWAHETATLETELVTIQNFHTQEAEGRKWPHGLFLHDGTLIGGIGWWIIREDAPSFELAYWMHTDHLNNGYMTEAVHAVIEALFSNNGAQRVVIGCDTRNLASAAVAKRLHFRHEGTHCNERRDICGELNDSHIFAHTPQSWENAKTKFANAMPSS